MNKIIKWVLIGLAVLLGLFGFLVLFMMRGMVEFHYGTPVVRPNKIIVNLNK